MDVKKIDRYYLLGLKLSVSQMNYEEDMRAVCLSSRDFFVHMDFQKYFQTVHSAIFRQRRHIYFKDEIIVETASGEEDMSECLS